LKREEKEQFVQRMKPELENAPSLVLADYRGLTVAQMTELRSRCREAGVVIKVAKNTLTRLALSGTDKEGLAELLEGPSALAWHSEDPGAPARVLVEFAKIKGNEALEIKGGSLPGRALSAREVTDMLATLPTREELLARFAGMLRSGPQRLHAVITAGPAKLGRALGALEQRRKEAA